MRRQRGKTVKVKAGETYRLEVYVREGSSFSWSKVTKFFRVRPVTCPLCLMRSWSHLALRCDFCLTTAETLDRARLAR